MKCLHSPAMRPSTPRLARFPSETWRAVHPEEERPRAMRKLRSHQFGWELLLFVGRQLEVVHSQGCRTQGTTC